MGGVNGCRYVGVDVGLGQVMAERRSLRILFADNPHQPCNT